jgi:hypothetical protein
MCCKTRFRYTAQSYNQFMLGYRRADSDLPVMFIPLQNKSALRVISITFNVH